MVLCGSKLDYFLFLTFAALIGPATCQTNIALGKTVTMSSQYTSSNPSIPPAPPENAVDGNTNGDWYVGGCASTVQEANPWMQIDLGDLYTVTSMTIYNRVDGNIGDRLSDFNVSFAAEDGVFITADNIFYSGPFPDVDSIPVALAYDIRYIRITLTDTDYLTICEWEVYGIQGPLDGGWTDWGAWSDCSSSCGPGTQTRSRSCTNPAPANGGADCVGNLTETMSCQIEECTVDGGWSPFNAWGPCSVTCSDGIRERTRTCTNPAPSGGGTYCLGCSSETELCVNDPCPVNGVWTDWSEWSDCSVTCASGTRSRSRSCTNPPPLYGGTNCTGISTETEACSASECPVDGGWSAWTYWSACSETCGPGTSSRSRSCTNPAPDFGGSGCGADREEETIDCYEAVCPVNGSWTAWGEWSTCSATCGTAQSLRTRTCTNPVPVAGGNDCIGECVETMDCLSAECPVHGGWTDWDAWSNCSSTCGPGTRTRSRSCTNPVPAHGGDNCTGEPSETIDCLEAVCPANGGWTAWGEWSTCSSTCGTGQSLRTRSCTNPVPVAGGNDCIGECVETMDCLSAECPVHGGWTDWDAWSECSSICGPGTRTRSRSCTNPVPAHGGDNCTGEPSETIDCLEAVCPVNGGWTPWGEWSLCSATCGTGHSLRTRSCTNPVPVAGGNDCIGDCVETTDCFSPACPVNGGWTAWSEWSDCSATCGTGLSLRSRSCTNPASVAGGSDCAGESVETMECDIASCPVHGGWSDWCPWSSCSATCGSGTQSRSRSCTNPAPAFGGDDCLGLPVEEMACFVTECPEDGGWSGFGPWSTCSVPCGTGLRMRSRSCDQPAPSGEGDYCVGCSSQTELCVLDPCAPTPVDGGWSAWGPWGVCSKTCGYGTKSRSRTCTNPSPANGGRNCIGSSKGTAKCFERKCPELCKWVQCSSRRYKYARCYIKGAGTIRSVKEVQRYSNSGCRFGSSYGKMERSIWVRNGCHAKFWVCYIVP